MERLLLEDIPLAELTSDELHARSAWAQVYLIRASQPDPSSGNPPTSVVQEHSDYLRQLESSGRLYACGPVEVLAADSVREMTVIAAASADEADRIARYDPFHRSGYRTNTVQGHIINEGIACYVAREMWRRAVDAAEAFSAVEDSSSDGRALAGADPGAELYLISLESTDKPRSDDAADVDHAHFVWLRENEMAARLLSCGPLEPAEPLGLGIWPSGLGVVATSREEAEHLAQNEPTGRVGYRALSVRGWTIRQGLVAPIARALQTLNALPTSEGDSAQRHVSRDSARTSPTLVALGLRTE